MKSRKGSLEKRRVKTTELLGADDTPLRDALLEMPIVDLKDEFESVLFRVDDCCHSATISLQLRS